MKFKVMGLACAAAMAAAGFAYAQDHGDHDDHGDRGGRRGERMIERLCGDHAQNSRGQKFAERMADRLSLTDAQKGLFKDLGDTRQKDRQDMKAALCSPKPDLSSFTGRLNFREKLLETRLAAMKAARPKLEAFYNSLDDKQKETFGDMRRGWGRHRGGHDEHQRHGRDD